jgi:thiamine kinase-like enzyme
MRSSHFCFDHDSVVVMTPKEKSEVQSIIDGIPSLEITGSEIMRLGGLTNRVYAVGPYVLRIPGKGTEEYINRVHEAEAAKIADAANVSPAVIYADSKTGVMVTHLVDAVTMTPQLFKTREYAPTRAGQTLRKLHCAPGVFPFRFELFAMIDEYLKVLSTKDVDLPDGYHDVVREAESIRAALNNSPVELAPCHCDPLCENFLDDGKRMWIVDWEYAGMNDPMWDLGDLSVEAGFDSEQDAELLQAYFDAAPKPYDHARMVIYKGMCDLLWTLWGLIQHANKNPADDFNAYARNRFERCKTLMATPAFQGHLKNLSNSVI